MRNGFLTEIACLQLFLTCFCFHVICNFVTMKFARKKSLNVYSESLPKFSQHVWYLKTLPQHMKSQNERKSGLSFQKWKVEICTQNWVFDCTAVVDCSLIVNWGNQPKTGACLHCCACEEMLLFQ